MIKVIRYFCLNNKTLGRHFAGYPSFSFNQNFANPKEQLLITKQFPAKKLTKHLFDFD